MRSPNLLHRITQRGRQGLAMALVAGSLVACGGGSGIDVPSVSPLAADGVKSALAADATSLTDAQALAYIASYDDLIEALGADPAAGRIHHAAQAAIEGRTIGFEPTRYVASYPELIPTVGANSLAAARHFILVGYPEGRNRGTFDALAYVAANPDLVPTIGTDAFAAARHYIIEGFNQGRPTSFEAVRYIASYADLIQSLGTDTAAATLHYIQTGRAQGRRPLFDAAKYLAGYADLQAAYGTDLLRATYHFILSGYREGRIDGVAFVPRPDPQPDPGPTPGTPPDPGPVTPPTPVADTAFLGSENGWRIDLQGKVSRTTDGGRNWTVVGAVPATGPSRIGFGSASNGWVLLVSEAPGGAPRIFSTVDGGASWIERVVPTPPPNPHVFKVLKAINATTVVVTNGASLESGTPDPADPRQIIVSRDGGQVWLIRTFDPAHISQPGVLWGIVGGQVLRTANFGQSSTATNLALDGSLFRVALFDGVNGLIVGRSGAEVYGVWRTRDGGTTWLKLAGVAGLPSGTGCLGASGKHGLVMSGSESATLTIGAGPCQGRLRTNDGGMSWTAAPT